MASKREMEAESIIDSYVKGNSTAAQTRNKLKKAGFRADLRTFIDNEIGVYDINMDQGFNLKMNKGGLSMGKKKDVTVVSIGVGTMPAKKLKEMKKAEMAMGGMANGKKHMYAAGGSVTENPGLKALKASGPKGMEAYNKITGKD